jgi:hypothetical protein
MWLLFARAQPPDAPYWSGRRWFATVDAVAWPALVWFALAHLAGSGGLVVALSMVVLVVSAARRLCTALFVNHRYHFTAWRWGHVLAWLFATGALLKVLLAV